MTMAGPNDTAALICVIDDDADVRGALDSLLRSAGYAVRAFAGPADYLASTEADQAACLILDIRLRGADGLALQAELNHLGRAFPVSVMTAFPTDAAREESEQLGAAAFLAKPIDPDALLDRIEGLLG